MDSSTSKVVSFHQYTQFFEIQNKKSPKIKLAQGLDLSNKGEKFKKPGSPQQRSDDDGFHQKLALSIHHIFEQILRSLDRTSLFQCRLVSHSWRRVSTKIIQRSDYHLSFEYRSAEQDYLKILVLNDTNDGDRFSPELNLKELTTLLKNSYTHNLSANFHLSTFPCNKLTFQYGSFSNWKLQSFLNTFGEHIQSLCLNFTTDPEERQQSELVLLMQVENLLIFQAPNLRSLSFCPNLKSNDETLVDFLQSLTSCVLCKTCKTQRRKISRLNNFTIRGATTNIFESIISTSPNIVLINIDFSNFNLLLENISQLHFIKTVELQAYISTLRDFENFKMLETTNSILAEVMQIKNIPVPTIKFSNLRIDFGVITDHFASVRVVKVINQILTSSWDSLEYISFCDYEDGYLNAIKWPSVLLKTCLVWLEPKHYCGLEILPLVGDLKLQETLFSKVKSVYVNSAKWAEEEDYFMTEEEFFESFLEKRGSILRDRSKCFFVNVYVKRSSTNLQLIQDRIRRRPWGFFSDYALSSLFPNSEQRVWVWCDPR